MTRATARFALGLADVLPPPVGWPEHLHRDDVLAHLVKAIADETMSDDYELRELLSSDLSLSSDDGAQTGELLVTMRADDVGGPLPRSQADALIARVDRSGRSGTIALASPFLAERTVIVPPFCVNGPLVIAPTHPLAGTRKVSAVAVTDQLDQLSAADPADLLCFRQLLDLCVAEKLVLSFTR